MTKEKYKEYLKAPEINLEFFYNFWVETKPPEYKELTLEEFSAQFNEFMFVHYQIPVMTKIGPRIFNYKTAIDKIFNYYNNKFNNETV